MRVPQLTAAVIRMSPIPSILACVAIIASVLAFAPSAAVAAAGTYSLTVPNTSSTWGWWTYGSSAPYAISDRKVTTKIGSFTSGEHRFWRLNVPDASVRIAGGSVKASMTTKNDAFEVRIRQGNSGGAVKSLLASQTATSFSGILSADSSWFEFGLIARAATTTTIPDGNWVYLNSLVLTLVDSVNPVLLITTMPDQDAWHGSGCTNIGVQLTDTGSGIAKYSIVNTSTNTVVETWSSPVQAGLQPGLKSVGRNTCISGAQQSNGTNTFTMQAYDASNRVAALQVRLRFDLVAPIVNGPSIDGQTFNTPKPTLGFSVADTASGVSSVATTIDDVVVPTSNDANNWQALLTSQLTPGSHSLRVIAKDAVGNVTSRIFHFTIVDTTAPTVTIVSPYASGSSSPWLAATAADESSGINTATWRVTVDGAPLPILAIATSIAAPIGTLTSGNHSIEVVVTDNAGNVGRSVLTYTVTTGGQGGAASIGGASGLFVSASPRYAVAYGSTVHIILTAALQGRPMEGHRVLVQLRGRLLASATADSHGVVDLVFKATSPGTLTLSSAGNEVSSLNLQLHVAPKLNLRASTRRPKVGAPVLLTGRINPVALRRVALQARIGSSWYPLRRLVSVDANGRFTTTVRSSVKGIVAVRVVSAARSGWSRSYSNIIVLRVHR